MILVLLSFSVSLLWPFVHSLSLFLALRPQDLIISSLSADATLPIICAGRHQLFPFFP